MVSYLVEGIVSVEGLYVLILIVMEDGLVHLLVAFPDKLPDES